MRRPGDDASREKADRGEHEEHGADEQRSGAACPIDRLPEHRDPPGHGDTTSLGAWGWASFPNGVHSPFPFGFGTDDRSFSGFLSRSRAASDPAAP